MSESNKKQEKKKTEKKIDVEKQKKTVKISDAEKQKKISKKKKNKEESKNNNTFNKEIDLEEENNFLSDSENTTVDDDLPEDIKKKLEKNKTERLKSKRIKKKRKKIISRKVQIGKAYIKATYNNTIVTLTDLQGNVISWASAGMAGFKGPKKATPYAAQIIAKIAIIKAREEFGLEEVSVYVSGIGTGRESAIRSLNANRLAVTFIKDVTPIPHNGCRPKGARRV